jgi:hypothetical protein
MMESAQLGVEDISCLKVDMKDSFINKLLRKENHSLIYRKSLVLFSGRNQHTKTW